MNPDDNPVPVYAEVGSVERNSKVFTIDRNKSYSRQHIKNYNCSTTEERRGNKYYFTIIAALAVTLLLILAGYGIMANILVKISALQDEVSSLQRELKRSSSSEMLNRAFLENVSMSIEELNRKFSTEIKDVTDSGVNASCMSLCPTATPVITSCAALPPSSPSGNYEIRASNGSAVHVYCDMTRTCGNVTGGWMRVGYLDMTNSSHQCPSGLGERNNSDIRTCVRSSDSAGCISVTIHSYTQYSMVCGKIKAYQFGTTNAFQNSSSISHPYVDGVSFTHGNPRQHIWTFAAALDKSASIDLNSHCPCQNAPSTHFPEPPPFVGTDYFCDSGNEEYNLLRGVFNFFSADPLWDGAGCEPPNTCCSFNTPPWFYKQLPQPTTDDIEMRVCRDQVSSNEDVALESVQLYIHS